jgi:hypothetical protein
MQPIARDVTRIEGLYAEWVNVGDVPFLQIERVNKDYSVTRISLTRAEARVLGRVLGGKCESASCI